MGLLDFKGIAQTFGMSLRTVERLRRDGKLPEPTEKRGNRLLWDEGLIKTLNLNPATLGGDGASTTPVGTPLGEPEVRWTEADNIKVIEFLSEQQIKTEQDALKHAEIDTSVWYVDRIECGAWQTPMRVRQGQDAEKRWKQDVPLRVQCWKVKLHLRRIRPKAFQDAADALFERLAKKAPKFPTLKPRKLSTGHLVEIDIFDAHFGKYAWSEETGHNYDLRIAEQIYARAVEDLVAMAERFPAAKFVLPVGNDFLHVDGVESQTTRGTRVDSDGRFAKIIEAGEMALINAIELLAGIAPVDVLWVPGNHDRVASYQLTRTIKAYFRHAKHINVDVGPKTRKYVRFGCNLIGYVHGDKIKPPKLPAIMATECGRDWGETTCHEWRMGHFHRPGVVVTTPVVSHEGVTVRTLQSLSATDAWHYENGFVGNRRVAECLVSDPDKGLVANFFAVARED